MPHSPDVTKCFLCGQIAGDATRDLLSQMLPSQPYRRRVILENDAFAVIPSLGPLTAGHVLLCPKEHNSSFAHLGGCKNECVEESYSDLKERLRQLLEKHYTAAVHVFEHGMATDGNHIPCTTDHAHLHFIPVPRSVKIDANGSAAWTTCDTSLAALAARACGQEYLLHETPAGVTRISTGPAGSFPSQSMRRFFAAHLGCDELWNWRTSPQPEAADETWRALRSTRSCDRGVSDATRIAASSTPSLA